MNELTQDRLKEIFEYNPENGYFIRIIRVSRKEHIGDIAGFTNKAGYHIIKINEIAYKAHRLAWLYIYGKWPENHIDHINGIKNDNRITNLRDVIRSVNIQNQLKPQKNNKIGLLGVSKYRNRYVACLSINGKVNVIGRFDDPIIAHHAYLEAKRKLHKGCTI